MGADDFLITAEQRVEVKNALKQAGVPHQMIVYPNVQHDFFRENADSFNQSARDDAWKQTLELFDSELNV